MNDELHALIDAFSRLPGAEVGTGPEHPTRPNVALAGVVEQYLKQKPYLGRHPDYVEFLRCYGGCSIRSKSDDDSPDYLFLMVWGFDDLLLDSEEDENFFLFAEVNCGEGGTVTYDYAFPKFGSRASVCRARIDTAVQDEAAFDIWRTADGPTTACDTFVDWLRETVRCGGRSAPFTDG